MRRTITGSRISSNALPQMCLRLARRVKREPSRSPSIAPMIVFEIVMLSNARLPLDLIPVFGTKLSMISANERGSGYVEEQAHGGADDRGAETTGGRA